MIFLLNIFNNIKEYNMNNNIKEYNMNNNIISNDYCKGLYWVFNKNPLSITIEEKKYIYSKDHKVYTPELKPIKNIIKRNKIVKFNL